MKVTELDKDILFNLSQQHLSTWKLAKSLNKGVSQIDYRIKLLLEREWIRTDDGTRYRLNGNKAIVTKDILKLSDKDGIWFFYSDKSELKGLLERIVEAYLIAIDRGKKLKIEISFK